MANSAAVDRVTPVGSAEKFTLISMLVECILYGVLMILCCISLFMALRNHARSRQASYRQICIHAVGFLMFVLASIHVSVDMHRVLNAFLGPDPVAALIPIDNAAFLVKEATYGLQTVFGDAFWLYRLHVVWMGDKRVFIPLLIILLADAGLSFYNLYLFSATPSTLEDAIFLTRTYNVAVAVLTLTLVVNLSCTILIATRLYLVNRRVKGRMEILGENRNVISTFAILVAESGALYSALLLIFLVAFITNSYVASIFNDAIVQAVGIVFYILIFQAKLGKLTPSTTDTTTSIRPSDSLHNQPRICNIPLRRMSNISQGECDVSSAGALEPECPPKVVHVTRWDSGSKV